MKTIHACLTTAFFAASFIVAPFVITPAQSASFNCSKATTNDELAICANPTLSSLDSQMAGLWYGYRAMPLLMGASGIRHDEAEAFLKSRGDCGSNSGCLAKLYHARIATLEKNIDDAIKNYCTN